MRKLKPHAVDWAQIDRFLASADKKLASARKILAFDEEACLQQAYEAMLKASLGFMFSHGFRARSPRMPSDQSKPTPKEFLYTLAGDWASRSETAVKGDGQEPCCGVTIDGGEIGGKYRSIC